MLNQAVILCGGLGTRLGSITKKTPKPLLRINKKSFIEYQIQNLARHGIKQIILLCCFRYDLFKKKYHNKVISSVKILCFNENIFLGTGGGLSLFKKHLDTNFLVLNGDTIFDINYLDLYSKFKNNKLACIATTNKKGARYLKLNKDGNLINAGIYLFKKKIFKYFKKQIISLEKDIFPKLYTDKKIQYIFYDKKKYNFLDIGIPKDFEKASRALKKSFFKPALFLDRDGVINKDLGYVYKIKDFKWVEGIKKIIKYYNDNNYYVFVITNQSGIGRGYYDINDVDKLHSWIQLNLKSNGSHIDKFYIAPYYKENKIFNQKDKKMRKPNTGMIDLANKEWSINMKKSIFIGDQKTDKILANKVKLKFFMVEKKITLTKLLNKLNY